MTPAELSAVAKAVDLKNDNQLNLRIAFGVACASRVEHLITESELTACLQVGKHYLLGKVSSSALAASADRAAKAARSHAGSGLIDGCGNAAVSASYSVAAALAARALVAAEYAAYASVYAYSASAVTDIDAYHEEHQWQIAQLKQLAENHCVL
ncbi:MAG: hypothetical protein KTR32_43815 [Granulosicoccus sp.]|nr:hypothetical protein [Granulosicoccus sp.]